MHFECKYAPSSILWFATEALVIDLCSLAIVLPDNVKYTVDKMTEDSPSKAGTKPCCIIVPVVGLVVK